MTEWKKFGDYKRKKNMLKIDRDKLLVAVVLTLVISIDMIRT